MPRATLSYQDFEWIQKSLRKNVPLLLELKELSWKYRQEVHGVIEGLENSQSKSLMYWEQYFETYPRRLTGKRAARMKYLQGTLGSFEVSEEMHAAFSRREEHGLGREERKTP